MDNTAQIQTLINNTPDGGLLEIPAGTYIISSPLTITSRNGLRIVGQAGADGSHGVVFQWAGDATAPLFLIEGSTYCVFEYLNVVAPSGATLRCGFSLQTIAATPQTQHTFKQCFVNSHAANVGRGWEIVPGPGGDAHNEQMVFDRCTVQGHTDSGFYISGANACEHTFRDCGITSDYNGNYGVNCQQGSFQMYGGAVNEHNKSDFYIGQTARPILLSRTSHENSNRLITTAYDGASHQITLDGVRFVGYKVNPADFGMMLFSGPGPYIIRGCNFGGATPITPLQIIMDAVQPWFLTAEGNAWVNAGANLTLSPLVNKGIAGKSNFLGNAYYDVDGHANYRTDGW